MRRSRVLILGGYGMLGHSLWQACQAEFQTWATVRTRRPDLRFPDRETISGVEAAQIDTVARALEEAQPEWVVNCIGLVKQRRAAADPIESIRVNALFPHQVARLCERSGARLIQIGTDCVFSGERGNRSEADVPDARDLYGRSKLLGEVAAGGCLTIRTSLVGRELGARQGLVEWFLSALGQPVPGYTNAFFSGLTTQVFADLLVRIMTRHPALSGVWHVAGPRIGKYDLLCILRDEFGVPARIVRDASVAIDRSLDDTRFRQATGWSAPPWRQMIAQMASLSAESLAPCV